MRGVTRAQALGPGRKADGCAWAAAACRVCQWGAAAEGSQGGRDPCPRCPPVEAECRAQEPSQRVPLCSQEEGARAEDAAGWRGPGQRSLRVPRKQEELVQQVRKRLEEALAADMLAHVEELARGGAGPLDKAGADEDDDEDDDEDEDEPDQDQEMERV